MYICLYSRVTKTMSLGEWWAHLSEVPYRTEDFLNWAFLGMIQIHCEEHSTLVHSPSLPVRLEGQRTGVNTKLMTPGVVYNKPLSPLSPPQGNLCKSNQCLLLKDNFTIWQFVVKPGAKYFINILQLIKMLVFSSLQLLNNIYKLLELF